MSKLQQIKSPASGPAIKLPADKPPDAKQLKVSPDPFIMSKLNTATNMATDGKMLVNALYHTAVVSGLTTGYTRPGKMVIGGASPKLDFTARDVSMVDFIFDFTAACVVPCGGRKTSPLTSTIVQFIFYFGPLRSAIIF